MTRIRLSWTILLVVTAGLAASHSAADTLILRNGDFLAGDLDLTELAVSTPQGIVRVGGAEVRGVTLGTGSGDVVEFRTGRALTGVVDRSAYTIRLPSGQAVVVGRDHVDRLQLRVR